MSGGPPPEALDCLRAALSAGPDAWIVGGAVRERLRGRTSTDVDVAVGADAGTVRTLARRISREVSGHGFALSEAFGAWRVTPPDRAWQIDLTPLQGADLLADLAGRDLTINAIAEPVGGGAAVDPYGGAADLASATLRMVSASAFRRDPVRVLRLGRFSAELDARITADTLAAARDAAPGLRDAPGERLLPEVARLLLAPGRARGVEALEDTRALTVILPGAVDDAGAVGPATRTLLARVLDPEATVPEADDADRRALAARSTDEGRRLVLGLAAILRGAPDPAGALDPLRPARRLRRAVAGVVAVAGPLGALRAGAPDRRIHDLLRPLGRDGPEAVLFARADAGDRDRSAPWATLLARALRWSDRPPQSPIPGGELSRALGIPPGPQLGRILEVLAVEADAGRLHTLSDALDRARTLAADGG